MNTRPDERLPYLELARQGARVERSVQAEALPRLAELAPAQGPLHVAMTFHLDANGRPRVTGRAHGALLATCQGCLEQLDHDIRIDFDLCIVRDPAVASLLAEEMDVLVVEAERLSIADVVEDELILSLPERLCRETPCPLAPALTYPADEGAEAPQDNPFRILSVLKRR